MASDTLGVHRGWILQAEREARVRCDLQSEHKQESTNEHVSGWNKSTYLSLSPPSSLLSVSKKSIKNNSKRREEALQPHPF